MRHTHPRPCALWGCSPRAGLLLPAPRPAHPGARSRPSAGRAWPTCHPGPGRARTRQSSSGFFSGGQGSPEGEGWVVGAPIPRAGISDQRLTALGLGTPGGHLVHVDGPQLQARAGRPSVTPASVCPVHLGGAPCPRFSVAGSPRSSSWRRLGLGAGSKLCCPNLVKRASSGHQRTLALPPGTRPARAPGEGSGAPARASQEGGPAKD